MSGESADEPRFFEEPGEFRAWLFEHHETASELWVGFYKRGSGISSITWSEAVDEALCVGWIDAVGKSIDSQRRVIRFTRRRPRSIWSLVNVAKIEALTAEGRMQPAGLRAFGDRKEDRTGIYSHEQSEFPEFPAEFGREFRENVVAWEYFESRPGSYRKAAIWSILSAKRDETQRRRLDELIACSARGVTVPRFTSPVGKK